MGYYQGRYVVMVVVVVVVLEHWSVCGIGGACAALTALTCECKCKKVQNSEVGPFPDPHSC